MSTYQFKLAQLPLSKQLHFFHSFYPKSLNFSAHLLVLSVATDSHPLCSMCFPTFLKNPRTFKFGKKKLGSLRNYDAVNI